MALRIGCGSGGEPDQPGPARDLVERGNLDYLCFESLAERTLAQGHVAARSASPGYSRKLETRFRAVLTGCHDQGIRIITNMGSADPLGAGHATADLARSLGLKLKIAVIEGDDVRQLISGDTPLEGVGGTVAGFGKPLVSANAYIGAEPIVEALHAGADIVVGGRISDSALFLAPIMHELDIALDNWDRIAKGILVGHLLECSTQVTGGYFADPGYKDVPDIDDLGYPIAEVQPDGSAVITKLPDVGGCVTELTVKEQLLYEVHDPSAYLTPDVSADFSRVTIQSVGKDRVRVDGAAGRQRPDRLKVQVGFEGGYLGEGEIGYAGPGARQRAELARDMIHRRIVERGGFQGDLRLDLIGVNSIHATAVERSSDTQDVRLRAALRSRDRQWADRLVADVESLWMGGPAGGGGFRGRVTETVVSQPTYIDRELVQTRVTYIET
ncbi:uncharacterized protein DUF1446 [Mesorhizobium sp. J18]|uniref:acyclic terpene utilization AtuA family protein n=1 Tax=Mesorhizobium sp. J18 TaxID=935263 RepID=UPI001198CCAC|nr:acyclic terpene utilization AtuA family protein [Mesorhizobium sp. J18]TWG96407.1 uncharacterized protein DUF1446 [Mesorhizobium sp. J18]